MSKAKFVCQEDWELEGKEGATDTQVVCYAHGETPKWKTPGKIKKNQLLWVDLDLNFSRGTLKNYDITQIGVGLGLAFLRH